MASHNEYFGYVKLPKKKLYETKVRLDFNGSVDAKPGYAKLEGFSLRLFVPTGGTGKEQPEMSVTLRPEEWLDLIESMKEEFELVQRLRKELE